MQLTGFHHLTAVTADIVANHTFYTNTLGLRLVKKSVNQDDVSAYHLFYADGKGSPGTDITFFDWPLPREHRGSGSVARTGFRVKSEADLCWWEERLHSAGVLISPIQVVDGRLTLHFEDGEGQRLALVDAKAAPSAAAWKLSPVPEDRQILGLGPITMNVRRLEPTARLLTQVLLMRQAREYEMNGAHVHVFEMASGGPSAELHVAVQPDEPLARLGAGGVHHVAFRTTLAEYEGWHRRLLEAGVPSSGPVDRYYFKSLYFREPGGVLFEIATDEPGFAADESLDSLGKRLALPPFLEPRRAEIEAGLVPLQ
ncbi:MAG: ring-cleaving dioxygenase [Nibricoccus sp.]